VLQCITCSGVSASNTPEGSSRNHAYKKAPHRSWNGVQENKQVMGIWVSHNKNNYMLIIPNS
jgi:hypothetical protein